MINFSTVEWFILYEFTKRGNNRTKSHDHINGESKVVIAILRIIES